MDILAVELLSADLPATLKFYTEVLGLKAAFISDTAVRVEVGRSQLTFIQTGLKHPFYHFAFEVPNNQINQVAAWAAGRLALIPLEDNSVIADFVNWNAKSVYCYDNNGNILEFIARFDNPTSNDSGFNGDSILAISEIGLVAEDVMKLAEQIMAETGCSFFSKQSPRPDFSVLGNDNGLLILSSDKRCWYPTPRHAISFPTKVTLSNNGNVHVLDYT